MKMPPKVLGKYYGTFGELWPSGNMIRLDFVGVSQVWLHGKGPTQLSFIAKLEPGYAERK